ncbi:hypothetical protein L6452_19305 [Arctium lappa]|uniref:Uncharacterized protein n=1 Tax=Arctium lappa TaxID=4217 RepID=A0ACB9B930_ARCLA|nr:hypothetical protein L6452_19305 [Arctium lappa]
MSNSKKQLQGREPTDQHRDHTNPTYESKREAPKDKSKKIMIVDQEFEEAKKKKHEAKYRQRHPGADTLKLKPPSKVSTVLGLPEKGIEEAAIAQKLFDESIRLSMEVAREEVAKTNITDPIKASLTEFGSMEKSTK